ncbi:MAG: PD-(D/E)XK nuclease family protein [Gammaproteobacteria bacterium]|jgi:probable DNA repair protein
MLDDLFAQLNPDTLILTANKRLANWLVHQYKKLQTARNINTWISLNVSSLDDWLMQGFFELQTKAIGKPQVLLNPEQTFLLWQTIIKNQINNELLSINATASSAQDAWKLLQKYNIALDDPEILQHDDNYCWKNWAETFTQNCKENNWIDPYSLIKFIAAQTHNLNQPKRIILVGFLEITPAEQLLFDRLNCEIINYETSAHNQSIQCAALPNIEEEIFAMANWAKQQNSNYIGCIIPNLNEIYNDIKRIFAEVFTDNTKYNISYGDKLSNEPIIYTALEILSLNLGKIHIDDIGYLLRSPFIGNFEDLPKRALLNVQLRQTNQTKLNLKQLEHDIFKPLQTVKFEKYLSPYAWINVFKQQLDAVGWPGTRKLTNQEYKTIERWHKLLEEFATLSLVKNSFTYAQALSHLKYLASQTLFQIEKPPTKIQILGVLEATGLPFDDAWIMDLNDKTWPNNPKPNPFLSINLQKKYNMQHATTEREYHFTCMMTDQFIRNSTNITFSYPAQDKDGTLQPSPLIKNFPTIKNLQIKSKFKVAKQQFTKIIDNQAPTLQENETLHASSDILEQQAACPFRAFAKYRLHTEEIPEPSEGINSLERGLITHKILEIIWQELKTHEKLCTIQGNKLNQLIDTAIKKTLNTKSEFAKLEQLRLQKLIYDWLQLEKTRSSFVVEKQEQKYSIKCGKLELKVRVDRIDQADNNYILIDYKTSKTSINDWFGDRPNKPQLPLYAANIPHEINDIAFAQISPGKLEFKNAATKINWEEQLKLWKKTTTRLANDFYTGNALVDPKNPTETCRYCKLHGLCRIYEHN